MKRTLATFTVLMAALAAAPQRAEAHGDRFSLCRLLGSGRNPIADLCRRIEELEGEVDTLSEELAECEARGSGCPSGEAPALCCPTGEAFCPSVGCTDLSGDPANCGACENACAAPLSCVAGRCALSCSAGSECAPRGDTCAADGTCACGGGPLCAPNAECSGGECIECGRTPGSALASCAEIRARCPGTPSEARWIAPAGVAPFLAYCDNDRDGGGWTLVAKIHRFHGGPALDEPPDWFSELRDEPSLVDSVSYADRVPGQASHGGSRIAALAAASALARFTVIAEDDTSQTATWFKAIGAQTPDWFSDRDHPATTVCTDLALTENCSNGRVGGAAGGVTTLEGMNLGHFGYSAGCGDLHMRQNTDDAPGFSAVCSCTGNADGNAWRDDAIDGHWGNGLEIWMR